MYSPTVADTAAAAADGTKRTRAAVAATSTAAAAGRFRCHPLQQSLHIESLAPSRHLMQQFLHLRGAVSVPSSVVGRRKRRRRSERRFHSGRLAGGVPVPSVAVIGLLLLLLLLPLLPLLLRLKVRRAPV